MSERMEGPNPEEQPKEEDKFSPERILALSPKEMTDLFTDLQTKGELESFLEKSADNDALVAQFSYWEKWLEKDQRRLVDEVVARKRKIYEGTEDKESLPLHLEKKFSPEELSLIFSRIGSIQLCFGCSKGCPFCAFDALPAVRENIPYSQLANLFQKYGKDLAKSKPFLYWASEPSDYASKMGLEDKTYQDIHQLAVEYAGYVPHITSKETSNEKWLEFLGIQANLPEGRGARVSVFGQSTEKAEEIKEKHKNIKTTGEGYQHIKGLGLSSETQEPVDFLKAGIGCINGILLTPRGLYGVAQLPVSKEFPQGQIISPLEEISDIEIKIGDKLKNILRKSIILSPTGILDSQEDEKSHISSYIQTTRSSFEYVNFFEGEFRKQVDIKTKNKLYRVWYDENGVVESAREMDEAEEKRIEIKVKEFQRSGREIQDLDITDTWEDAFAVAGKMFKEGKLQGIAFVSEKELEGGRYVPTLLRGTGFSEEESLENLRQLSPMLYGENERFRLMFQKMKVFHPEVPEGQVDVLVIVYLKEGEKMFVEKLQS